MFLGPDVSGEYHHGIVLLGLIYPGSKAFLGVFSWDDIVLAIILQGLEYPYDKNPRNGGRRAPTSTWCPLGTLRETAWLSPSARRSSTTRLYPFHDATDTPKTEPPNLTKHPTSQPQYQRGRRAPSYVRPHDGERNLSLHFSRPTIVYGAGTRRLRDTDAKQKAGHNQHNLAATNSKERMPKKTTTLYSDVQTRQNQSPTSRNTKNYSPSTVEGVAPLTHTSHDGERNLSNSVRPARQLFTAWKLRMTR